MEPDRQVQDDTAWAAFVTLVVLTLPAWGPALLWWLLVERA